MEMMMMSSRYSSGVVGNGGDACFFEMFDDLHSFGSGDLFEFVWQGGGGPAGRRCTTEMMHAGGGSLPSSLPPADDQPPSEDEMAAWLYAIVSGEVEPAVAGGLDKPAGCGGGVARRAAEDDQLVPTTAVEATKTEVKCTEDTVRNCSERGKQIGGRKSRHSETHNLIEKRRRRKINEKFKRLQQLVPGCNNKSNQTSTLEQTIKYIKSLQHQIQAVSFGCRIKQSSTAVYPVVQVPPPPYDPPPAPAVAGALPLPPPGILVRGHVWPEGVVLGPPPPAILPFAATLPLPPYPALPTV